jgi:hypothetical protein
VPFVASLYSADFSGGEDLKAAVSLKYIYVKRLFIHCASAITIDIGAGQSTGVTTIYLGPIPFSASGPAFNLVFGDTMMQIALSTALSIDASGSGAAMVLVEGLIGE